MRWAALTLVATAFAIEGPVHEYGRVVFQKSRTTPPVVFDHFRHRARYTCRLCHVDVGFAMTAGATGVTAATNRKGFHCGACHDGKTAFPACAAGEVKDGCRRCHGREDDAAKAYGALDLPRGAFGDFDWQRAEEEGKVHPVDAVAGVSIPRRALRMDRDVEIQSLGSWMTDVRFSHKKHAVWNGCEVCHPEIFPRTKAGEARFTMFDIAEGQSCGACHGKVAFALAYCDRCHVKPVRFP